VTLRLVGGIAEVIGVKGTLAGYFKTKFAL